MHTAPTPKNRLPHMELIRAGGRHVCNGNRRTSILALAVLLTLVLGARFAPNLQASLDVPTSYDVLIKGAQTIGGQVYEPRFPEVARCSNGDLLVVYYWNNVHVGVGSYGTIWITRSTNDGASWGTPTLLVDHSADGYDARDPNISVMSDGTVTMTYFKKVPGSVPENKGVFFIKSSNHGVTWTAPVQIVSNAATTASVVEANGAWLAPVYQVGGPVVSVFKSTNSGSSWSSQGTIINGGADESAAMYAGGNTLYSLVRYRGWISKSTDNGATWTSVDMARPEVHAPHALKLANDKFFVTWCRPNANNGNRVVEGRMFYPEYGWWSNGSRLIYNSTASNVFDMGYPSSVYLPDTDELFTVYYDVERGICAGTYTSMSDWSRPFNYLDTFESDATGAVPPAYVEVSGSARVSSAKAYTGSKSLRIHDNSSSALTSVAKVAKSDTAVSYEFKLHPNLPNGCYISLASGGNANSNVIFHLRISSSGNLHWYNGSTYTALSGASVILNSWNTVRIDASNTDSALVTVNGTVAGTAGKWNTHGTIDRIRFTSHSTTGVGDDIYVDNLQRTDYVNNFDRDTLGNVPANFVEVAASARVSNLQAYSGSNSLRIHDTSSSVLSSVVKTSNAGAFKTVEFKVKPVTLAQGFYISLGSGGNDNASMAFHIRVNNSGALSCYGYNDDNGGVLEYKNMSGASLALNAWNTVRIISLDMGHCAVFVNGVLAGYGYDWNTKTSIDRVRFTSYSSAGVGDDFYIDDLVFSNKYQ